jgi:hypothetical protein
MKNYEIKDKEVTGLVQEMLAFSNSLPKESLTDLALKLRASAKMVTPTIRNLYLKKTRLERIKGMIEANAVLDECYKYLELSEKLKLSNSKPLSKKINHLKK